MEIVIYAGCVIKMQCPQCRTIDTGKVGPSQYYCWQCLMEFKKLGQEQAEMFYVEDDGTLIPVPLSLE